MMTIDELDEIAQILFRDEDYRHFTRKIKNDFLANRINESASDLNSFYIDNGYNTVGFCILSESREKLAMWERVMVEEGWVDDDFKISPNSCELMYMYIMPEYRELRKASVLLERVMRHALSLSIEEIYAYVSAPDSYALDFYQKRGAEVICSFKDEAEANFTAFVRWIL